MFAAGHQPQTEAVLVQKEVDSDDGKDRHQHKPVELKAVDIHDKHLPGRNVLNFRRVIIRIGGGVHGLDKHGGGRGGQQVHGCADQRLVRFEMDCGDTQQA